MKQLATIFVAFLLGTGLLRAHEMEGGSTTGLFGLKAEYVHVILNPLPVYGLAMGALVLAIGLASRNRSVRNVGLLLVALCAASAWPVLFYGQHGYNHLYPQLDTESQQWLDVHMARAERFIYLFYATAVFSLLALLSQKKLPRAATALSSITLASAIACLGIGGWISRAGGEASHSEFRTEATPDSPSAQHHAHPSPENYSHSK